MKKFNRRDFLRAAAAGLGALAVEPLLAGCSSQPTEPAPTPSNLPPTATNVPFSSPTATTNSVLDTPSASVTSQPAATSTEIPSPAAEPAMNPDLVVARSGEPEDLVRRAIGALGGMDKFVGKGANVVIKPNICVAYHTYEYAATTNPWVVGALVKLCLEAGAGRVQVFDFPFGGTPQEAYTRSGIAEQVQAAGGEMVYMAGFKYAKTNLPQGVSLKQTQAYSDALNADVLIDVPIAKHHGSARLTLSMKNLMGLVLDRGSIHGNLGQRIADLASLFKPRLTVIDAVRILTANGPTGGSLDDVQKLDTVIASADFVAADSYATSLFGLTPNDVAYIPAAAAMGLGHMDLENIRIQDI